jgi:hypothetical protein
MKNLIKTFLFGFLSCLIWIDANAQTPPQLKIAKDSPATAQINWSNTIGTSYRVFTTSNLTNLISLWTPLEDAFSADANVSVSVSITNAPVGFFSVKVPTNGTLPAVQIFSPTNNQTVSGIIGVGVGAQIGNQLQGVNLYLDGALIGFVDSGGIQFNLDTTHFANVSHTLYAGAVDTANNETLSSSITLDFENPVRWLDADSLFQSFVPIDVESDISPATWTVFVSDTNGTIVRTFSGTTSDGNISTSWDGNDNNGNYAPDQTTYNILVVVTAGSSGNVAMSSSSLLSNSGLWVLSTTPNAYGVNEYQVQESVPDPMVMYSNLLYNYLQMPKGDRIIFPSFSLPANDPSIPTVKKLSAYDMFVVQHQPISMTSATGVVTPNGSSSAASGSTGTTVWREAPWNSGEIVLARQKLIGTAGLFFDGTVANLLANINNLVASAQDSVTGDRSTYQNSVLLMQHNGDFNSVNVALASTSPDTREFYFWGHGSPNGNSIGFREGTPNDGIKANDLKVLLGNYYLPIVGNSPQKIITHKPFDMVFLDGCMTGLGSLPEAFGIPKAVGGVTYNDNHKHKRAFMGWGGTISLSILDTESLNWSLAFWSAWLENPNSETIIQAQAAAFAAHPSGGSGAPMRTYGNLSLKWAD